MRILLIILLAIYSFFLGVLAASPLDLISPLEVYEESSGWGPRRLTVGGSTGTFHTGVDLVAPEGTRIRAAAAGVVRETWFQGWHDGKWYDGHQKYGVMVRIEHADGSYTLYGHLSQILTYEGEQVLAGRTIGTIGNTGYSTGTHLHFEHQRAPVIPASAPPPDPVEAFLGGNEMGFLMAEQRRLGD